MKKVLNLIDKKLVYQYILGDYIEAGLLEQLEDSPIFMQAVMEQTNDIKMYELCSDDVKHDFDFVVFLIEYFSHNISFVESVGKEFVKYRDSLHNADLIDIHNLEVMIRLNNVYVKHKMEPVNEFTIRALAFRVSIQSFISDYMNRNGIKESGLGFCYVLKLYNESDVICDYFAKAYIQDIFYGEEYMKLEELLHNKFKDRNKVINKGMKNFLIEYIANYDQSLSLYLINKNELLNHVVEDMRYCLKRWDNYEQLNEEKKLNVFCQEMSKYMDVYNGNLNLLDVVDYVGTVLNITPILNEYFPGRQVNEPHEGYNYIRGLLRENLIDVKDTICINYIKRCATEIFKSGSLSSETDDYNEKTPIKAKIYYYPIKK